MKRLAQQTTVFAKNKVKTFIQQTGNLLAKSKGLAVGGFIREHSMCHRERCINRQDVADLGSDANCQSRTRVYCCVHRQSRGQNFSDKVVGFDDDTIARQMEKNAARIRHFYSYI